MNPISLLAWLGFWWLVTAIVTAIITDPDSRLKSRVIRLSDLITATLWSTPITFVVMGIVHACK